MPYSPGSRVGRQYRIRIPLPHVDPRQDVRRIPSPVEDGNGDYSQWVIAPRWQVPTNLTSMHILTQTLLTRRITLLRVSAHIPVFSCITQLVSHQSPYSPGHLQFRSRFGESHDATHYADSFTGISLQIPESIVRYLLIILFVHSLRRL